MHYPLNKPLVSVIIPNYNHSSFIKERIESVLNQTYFEIEVIILDDNSIDNSWEIIREYSKNIKVSHVEKNVYNSGGTFFQWRKGIQMAKGDYIWIAESDDVADLNFLKKVMNVFENNKNVSVVFTASNMIDENSTIIGDLNWWLEDFKDNIWFESFIMKGVDFISKFHSVRNVIMNASSAVFRKEYYFVNEHNNINYKLCGDWITWISMIKDSNVAYLKDKLNNYRFHKNTVRENSDKKNIIFKESFKVRSYCFDNFLLEPQALNSIYFETYNNILRSKSGANKLIKAIHFIICYIYLFFKNPKFSIGFLKYLLFVKTF